MSKFHFQGEITIYVDSTDEEDWGSTEAADAIRSMKEWLKDEYRLRGMGRDEYDITLTAEPVEEEAAS